MTASYWTKAARTVASTRERSRFVTTFWSLMLVVFSTNLAVAMWLNSRDYLWGDAQSRAASALIALHSADPHFAAIGFVWMPLPTALEIIPVSFYPFWQDVVASGFAASLVTVVCGTLTSAIVYGTCRKLDLSELLSAVYAIAVSFSPMLLLVSTNGMSEGVAAPFMIGSVCCLLLFWNDGQRRYVAASGVLLALSFACIYQAAHFGAALLVALVIGIWAAENAPSWPQGRLRAVQGLGILLLVPSAYFAILWMTANAAIMGDPLYFATSSYSNEGVIASAGLEQAAATVKGDMIGSLGYVVLRTLPFSLPIAAILIVRLIEGRLLKPNTATLVGLAFVVPFGLILPQLYGGQSLGWLRYFIYPMFVAAGWGAYEISKSRHRGLATTLVLAGWVLAVPASLWAMADPELGQKEYLVVRSLTNGQRAADNGYPLYFKDVAPVAAALDALDKDARVLMDSSNAWTMAATVSRDTLKHKLVLTSGNHFHAALRDPAGSGVDYLLVPNPKVAPQDLLNAEHPGLWEGTADGFTLAYDFSQTGVGWRLYRVGSEAKQP